MIIRTLSYIIILTFSLICQTAYSQNQSKYLDEDNHPISKSAFDIKSKLYREYLVIPDEPNNQIRLVRRQEKGVISDIQLFRSILDSHLQPSVNWDKTLIIIYYSGEDPCNTGGSTTREWLRLWYIDLENRIAQIENVKPIYIYKDNKGLKKYPKMIKWQPDPENVVEKHFFKFHYPCGSFVCIAPDGKYISYFGEYAKENVIEVLKSLK